MEITKIEQQRNNDKRYSVFIDDKFVFGLSGEDVLYFKLKEGKEISQQQVDFILDNVVFTKARDSAFKYLGFKARTVQEVTNKLLEKQYSEEIIEKVMDLLKRYNYVDDYAFAKTYINERLTFKKIGKFRIKYELKEKGVADQIIETLLEETEFDEVSSAVSLIQKKCKNTDVREMDNKEKQKIYNFLLRKGFNYEVISAAFDHVMR